jgi:hypothetical protein
VPASARRRVGAGIIPRMLVLLLSLVVLNQTASVGHSVLLVPLTAKSTAQTSKPKPGDPPPLKLTSAEAGVAFDIDADGDLDQVAWTERGAEIAFLAIDLDADGKITSGKELIGSQSVPGAHNAFDGLIELFKTREKRVTGAVQAGDELYDRLLLWVDRNHNGSSDAGELRPAKELFTRIGLGYFFYTLRDEHGNRYGFAGWLEARTGGPEQRAADDRADHVSRIRDIYDVTLIVR